MTKTSTDSKNELSQQLEAARRREQISAWDRAEIALREQLGLDVPKRELSADVRDRFSLFEKWCSERGVRRLPAKSWTVAAFILDQNAHGRDAQGCLALLAAIAEIHDSASLSDPTSSSVVNQVLDQIVKVNPPRSWPAADKAEFARLPPTIREIIAKRENDRDREVRRKFNEIAELKRQALAAESALSERDLK
jgi:hypothetical protein